MELHGVKYKVRVAYPADELAMLEFDDGQVVGVDYTPGQPWSTMFGHIESWLKSGYSDAVIGHRLEPVTTSEVI